MKTLLKIAITISVFGFALTSNAQSFEMLDIVKIMDVPAKPKASGKKSAKVKKSRLIAEEKYAIPAEQLYSDKASVLEGANRAEVSSDRKRFTILPVTDSSQVLPSGRQEEPQLYNRKSVPAVADPRVHRNNTPGLADLVE